jgi:hypothetical protein
MPEDRFSEEAELEQLCRQIEIEDVKRFEQEQAADLARAEADLYGPIDRRRREFRGYKLPKARR